MRLDWKPFVKGEYTRVPIDVDHFDMFEPPIINNLSGRLSEFLAKKQAH